MKQTVRKYIVNFILIFVFAFIAIYFSIHKQFDEIVNALLNANVVWLLIILVIAMTPHFIQGIILTILARLYNPNYRFKQGVSNSFIGALFSGLTPFASGGQFFQTFAFSKQGLSTTSAISVLLMEFIVFQSTLVIYTFVILAVKFQEYTSKISSLFSLALIGFSINLFVFCMLFFATKSKNVQYFLTNVTLKILAKLRIIKNYEIKKQALETKIVQFRSEVKTLIKNKKVILITVILNILRLTTMFSIPFFIMFALNIKTSVAFLDFLSVCAFLHMITSFIPIPGASGGSEGGYVLFFGSFIGMIEASSSMILWRFATYYLLLIVGFLVFGLDRDLNSRRVKI